MERLRPPTHSFSLDSKEEGQTPVFMESFNGDRLPAFGQIDSHQHSSTNYRVSLGPYG